MSAEFLEGNLVGFPGVFCHPIERLTCKSGVERYMIEFDTLDHFV